MEIERYLKFFSPRFRPILGDQTILALLQITLSPVEAIERYLEVILRRFCPKQLAQSSSALLFSAQIELSFSSMHDASLSVDTARRSLIFIYLWSFAAD